MHNREDRFLNAVAQLTKEERDLGTLPQGYLYCGCQYHEADPYKAGVVAFYGHSASMTIGACMSCGKLKEVDKEGRILFFDDKKNPVYQTPPDPSIWEHVKRRHVEATSEVVDFTCGFNGSVVSIESRPI